LRVLQIGNFYPPHRGGIGSYLQELCAGLQKFVDLQVLVSNLTPQTTCEMIDGVKVRRVGMWAYPARSPICPAMALAIRRMPADIVHFHHPNPVTMFSYLLSGHPGKLIISYHSDIVRQKILKRMVQPILSLGFQRCNAFIASSSNYVESSAVLRKYRDRCRVIPYGISTDVTAIDQRVVDEIRRLHGPRVVLSVGRLVYYKGFEFLIRAMSTVRAKLLIVGEGPLRPRLEEEVRRLRLSARVSFLGDVEQLAHYYHAADVFVLPSVARSEAFGIVQLEAMACGKPIVNTSLDSGVPFVSPDNITGLTVAPRDSRALAEAINTLLEQDELRVRLGEAGRLRVKSEFSSESMIHRTLDLYKEVLADHPLLEHQLHLQAPTETNA
jgi:glycosyltransferase involved in cell wall biosynthesis